MTKKILALITVLGLSACTSGKDHFSTEPGKGFGWKSMTETNRMIHQEDGISLPSSKPQPYLVTSGILDGVERIPEQYLRVWIPPYQDEQGNLHNESSVHTVIQEGQWKLPTFIPKDVSQETADD